MPDVIGEPARPAVVRIMAALEVLQARIGADHALEFASVDLTMGQAKILYSVTAAGELTMSDLAHRLSITLSTASGAVDRLVELGLLRRSSPPNDRRQVRVAATELGARTLDQFRELNSRVLQLALDRIAEGDLDVIERAVHILADALSPAPPDADGGPRTSHAEPGRVK
ncbi:MAG TPA: MarR family transcriptional regulator [Candidatus Limnocylindrales bacterium]